MSPFESPRAPRRPVALAALLFLVALVPSATPAAAAAVAVMAASPSPPPAAAEPAPSERVLDVSLSPAPAPPAATPGSAPATAAGSTPPAATGAPSAWPRTAPRPAAKPRPGSLGGEALFTYGVALLAALLLARRLFAAWRRRTRRCDTCHVTMRRLDPQSAFAHLDMAERTEHLVGDVTYTVWQCPTCQTIAKQGTDREVGGLAAGTLAAPVGSAAYQRRQSRASLSIWSKSSPLPPSPEGATQPGFSDRHPADAPHVEP